MDTDFKDWDICRAHKFVVVLNVGEQYFKVMQIMFSKRDGSIFIAFPYYESADGIAGILTLPGGRELPFDPELVGKVTSHRVKYSHHPDGEAHFSQDGRVKTEIKNQSTPILKYDGHAFTVQLRGLNDYARCRGKGEVKRATEKRTSLVIPARETGEFAHYFAGFVHPRSAIRLPDNLNCRPQVLYDEHQNHFLGFVVSSPLGTPFSDLVFVLKYAENPRFKSPSKSCLTFLGGFDCREVVFDHSQDAKCLGLIYPAENIEELAKVFGSIDFNPEENLFTKNTEEPSE